MMNAIIAVLIAFIFCGVDSFAPALFVRRTDYTTSIHAAAAGEGEPTIKPDILKPFLPAADPMYAVRGAVGENEFVLSRSGGPTKEELSNENLLKILMIQCSDLEVSTSCLHDSRVSFCSAITHLTYLGQYLGLEMFRIPF